MVEIECRKIQWSERVVTALTTLRGRDFETAEECYTTLRDVHPLVIALLMNARVIERVGRVRQLKSAGPALYEMVCQRYHLDFDRWLAHRNVYRVNRDRADQVRRWAQNDPPIWPEWDTKRKRLTLFSPSFPQPDVEWPADPPDDEPES